MSSRIVTGEIDSIWKALADPTRRDIIELLRFGPLGTSEIVQKIPRLSRFGVMMHLKVLRAAGLIATRRDGRRRVNSLVARPIREALEHLLRIIYS